ncbi:MAG: 30S ribosomal protein S6 [Propionibacteriaceae bacterium]|jgi:small subunit ribosomal protein S6|nr:30S ribosomal protein S6 [Propionibacteriaceae bacterium]
MRSYEIMILLDPEIDDRQVQTVIDNHLKPVTKAGGVVTNTDIMGRRRLAYEIKKKAEAVYVVVNLDAEPPVIKELDRRLSIDEKVLRAKVFRPEAK